MSSHFDYLRKRNSIKYNPVRDVKQPKAINIEGKTPAISEAQARRLLSASPSDTHKDRRDRVNIATFLYQTTLRREEFCSLTVGDIHERCGAPW